MLTLIEMGVLQPIPAIVDELLGAMSIQNKQEIMDAITKSQEQQSKEAQQQQQIQLEVLKAQIEDLKARAMANEGLGFERASRIEENRALAIERIAEAQKDRDRGTYERIKAVKELTDIDLNQLAKALEIIEVIQTQQDQAAGKQKEEALGETPQRQGSIRESAELAAKV
jgi:DNA-directed RNA polymerase beta subunit